MRRPRRRLVQMRMDHFVGRQAVRERVLARGHFEQHDAERIQVALRPDSAALQRLGRRIGDAAADAAAARRRAAHAAAGRTAAARTATARARFAKRPREPEVDDLHFALLGEDEVLRLHVAMHDAAPMEGLQSEGRIAADAPRQVFDRRSLLLQELAQRGAAHQFHHEVGGLQAQHRERLDAKDRRDVGVPHALPELPLGDEARLRLLVEHAVLPQKLDGDLGALVEVRIRRGQPRAVDRARRAAAEFLDEREAAREKQGGRGNRIVLALVRACVVHANFVAAFSACIEAPSARMPLRPSPALAPRRGSRHAARFRCRSASTTR